MTTTGTVDDRSLPFFAPRNAKLALALLLVAYGTAFVAFYPPAITVSDEGSYLRQTQMILLGSRTIEQIDPFTGEAELFTPHDHYPLGTALLMVPFVYLGGWQAGFWMPMLCTLLAVIVTARWLTEAGHSPLWAALILVYPPSIVMGRLAMSDAPSLLAAATGLWLFWRGTLRGGSMFLAAGLIAGLSVSLREGNALLFAPLFLGALLRREPRISMLILGGIAGLLFRGLWSWLYFEDPLFVMGHAPFSPGNALTSAPLYFTALLVLVPGGLVAGLAYRGPRRLEIVATVVLFTCFHLLYGYSAEESGWAKRLVLGPRYFVPMLPLLALCAADVWPRWAKRITRNAAPARLLRLERLTTWTTGVALAATVASAVGLQWAHEAWARDQARIRDAIYRETTEGAVVITNWTATGKFFDLLYGDRRVLRRARLDREHVARLVEQNEALYLVFVDRTDSAAGRADVLESASFRRRIGHPLHLEFDLQITPTDRLHIWRVERR